MKTKEGLWKLSPSRLYTYTECKSCFWVENHYKKAPSLPLLLNTAMDNILKSRFDQYRAEGKFPPEAQALEDAGIKPFSDLKMLNVWREKSSALKVVDEEVGYVLSGKIDDVLVDLDERLVPADYKSSGNAPAEDKQKYYRDQLNAYGFMFKKHGFEVSNRAYLLHYFVKDKSNPSISVKFDTHVDLVKIDLEAFEEKFKNMITLLNAPYPGHNPDCEKCNYYQGRTESIGK